MELWKRNHKVAKEETNPVEHNAGNNLVDAKLSFEPSDNSANTCSACGSNQNNYRNLQHRRKIKTVANNDCKDGTYNVLTLSANVKEANAESKSNCNTSKKQRCCFNNDVRNVFWLTYHAANKSLKRTDRVISCSNQNDGSNQQANKNCDNC